MRHVDDTTTHVVLIIVPDSATTFASAADWLDGQIARVRHGHALNIAITVPEPVAIALMREKVRPYAQNSTIGAMPLKFFLANGGELDKIVHLTYCTAKLFGELKPTEQQGFVI